MNGLPHLQDVAHEGRAADSSRLRPVHGQSRIKHGPNAFVSGAQAGAARDGGGTEGVVPEARQGHAYDHYGLRVIALESGTHVLVLPHRDGRAGLSYHVQASELVPLPMAYYHGEVPK